MTDIGKGLRTYLLTKAGVTTLVSTRIQPEIISQASTLPAIAYRIISVESDEHLTAASGFATTRVQFDCYAATALVARTVSEALRDVLHGYRGAAGAETVRGISHDGLTTSYQVPADGSDQGRYVHTIDFLVSHTETAPAL